MRPELFFWSGIPARIPVKIAASRLSRRIGELSPDRVLIWCKSTAADIAALAVRNQPVRFILRVAPAYVVSREIEDGQRAATIELADDKFAKRWSAIGIVRLIETPSSQKRYVIEGSNGIDHHALNHNPEVLVREFGTIPLYDLYSQILRSQINV